MTSVIVPRMVVRNQVCAEMPAQTFVTANGYGEGGGVAGGSPLRDLFT